jgi:diacylglycerol kinase family enzyme
MPLLVIYNPVCGSQSAKSLTYDHILPLLSQRNATVDAVIETEYAGHAGSIVAGYESEKEELTVVLVSGDGTLHEIVNHCYTSTRRVSFVLIPAGTANALYSSLFPPSKDSSTVGDKFQSLRAYLDAKKRTIPLTLSVTTFFFAPDSQKSQEPKSVVSAVVTSTSLHASILYDSEELRKEIPGLQRYISCLSAIWKSSRY